MQLPEEEPSPHDTLITWATSTQNVTINGIHPTTMPGKGLGMITKRDIKTDDILIQAPASTLLTVHPDRPPPTQSTLSVHGRLALALAFPILSPKSVGNRDLSAWKAIMPSPSSLRSSMPALWSSDLQSLLPAPAKALLAKQQSKLENDLRAASETLLPEHVEASGRAIEDVKREYVESWLLVNSRCFYWDYPVLGGALRGKVGAKRGRDGRKLVRNRNDCMAMCPVMDYFNHADGDGLKVSYNEQGFKVTADRDYAKGEELNISYGKHSNDFLLLEYGFTMTPNTSDHIPLDEHILPLLSSEQKAALEEANLLGDYLFTPPPPPSNTNGDSPNSHPRDLVCHRTQCALRMVLLPIPRWRRFVDGLDPTEGAHEQGAVDETLLEILGGCLEETRQRLQQLRDVEMQKTGEDLDAVAALMGRWRQMKDILDKGYQLIQSSIQSK